MFIYILMGAITILSVVVQNSLKSKFAKYSKVPLGVPMAGRDIANAMLQQNGCGNVQVTSVSGQLTDHFNPANMTVNLSEPVYATNSIAAAAVAAHECGHAIQHNTNYAPLNIRGFLVPMVNIGSFISIPMILVGVLLSYNQTLITLGIALFSLTLLFQLVTLPVEFDASGRALRILDSSGLLDTEEVSQAKKVLSAAAMTYVAAAAVSALQLLRLILMFGGRRRN